MSLTPATSPLRNLALSVLLNKDRRTDAICTRHDSANEESDVSGSPWYRSKKSLSREAGGGEEEERRKRADVEIGTNDACQSKENYP